MENLKNEALKPLSLSTLIPSINLPSVNLSQIFNTIDWELVTNRLKLYSIGSEWAQKNLSKEKAKTLKWTIDDFLMNPKNPEVWSPNLILSLQYSYSKNEFLLTIRDHQMDDKSSNIYEENNDVEIQIFTAK